MNSLTMSGVIVDMILFFVLAGNAVLGYKKGLAKVIFSFLSSIIAIILVLILYKPVTNYVIYNTKASEKLETIFEENLESLFVKDEQNTEQTKDSKLDVLKIFIGDEMGSLVEETKDSVIQYASVEISHKIISVIVFFALFTIIRLLLYIVRTYVEMVGNLPVIRIFNSSGGMIYGIIKGFFIIYIIFAILSVLLPMIGNNVIMGSIQNAPIGSRMFNHNILLNLIFRFL